MFYVIFYDLFGDKRDKSHDASFFDGSSQDPLMTRASAMTLGRINFALGIHKTTQKISILEIDMFHLVLAEIAELFFRLVFHK